MTVKVLGLQEDLSDGSTTVDKATAVRVVNTGASSVKLSIVDSSNTTVGSLTLVPLESVILQKSAEHKLSAPAGTPEDTVLASKVAHTN